MMGDFSASKVSEPMTNLDCGFVLPESVRQELCAKLQKWLDNLNRNELSLSRPEMTPDHQPQLKVPEKPCARTILKEKDAIKTEIERTVDNRPDLKPIYEIKADKEIPKASLMSKRRYKLQKRISCEEMDERMLKGLCVFCNELETPDHYLQHMNSSLLMIDSADHLSDSMVNEIGNEISSDSWLSNSIGCELETGETDNDEDRAVENEANTKMISAMVKEESIPRFQVPISKLEHGLQIHNASPTVCEDSQYVVGREGLCDHQKAIIQVSHVKARDELLMNSKNVTNNQDAHHLFDKMPLRIQSRRGHTKCHKTWRFKFKQRKQQRGKLRSAHQLVHRGIVMYKSLCSSAKVALMKKNKFSITWPMLKDDCFIEDDQVSHETLPLWLLIRSKFRNKNFQKMMREHGHFSHLKLKSDMGEDDEMFTGAKAVSMRFLLGIMLGITESDASQGQQAVFEKIVMMNEWLQPSLVIDQVMRSKNIKFLKRWMFKYKVPHLDTKVFETSDQCIRKRVFVGAARETKNNQPTLRFLMNTKQSCLSLRANRVWDPGGSNSENG